MKNIERLMAALAAKKAEAEALNAILSERDLTEEETAKLDEVIEECKKITANIDRAKALEATLLATASPVVLAGSSGIVVKKAEDQILPPGHGFVRMVRYNVASKGNPMLAAELARQNSPEQPSIEAFFRGVAVGALPPLQERAAVAPAMTTVPEWAGALVYQQNLSSEFVGLLYPKLIMGRLPGMRQVPFNVSIPRMTGGVTGGWVGEGQWKPVSAGAFDRITMAFTKYAVIVVFTDEMLRFSNPQIDALMQANIQDAFTSAFDVAFIDYTQNPANGPDPINSDGSGAAANAIPSTGNTVAQISADLAAMLGMMAAHGIPTTGLAWVMSERTKTYLSLQRTAQDIFAWRDEISRNMLLGYPVVESTNVPTNHGTGTNESFITLVACPEVLVAKDPSIQFLTSNEATLVMDSAPSAPATVSLFQTNMTALRGEQFINWKARRPFATVTLTSVKY